MKRYFLIPILMIASAFSLGAQDKNPENIKEKFFDAKIREFVYQLELTDAQKADFVPLYKRYDDEVSAAIVKPQHSKDKKEMTSEDAATIVKARLANQQKTLTIREKYVDEFAKVLEPRQLMRLFNVENQIQNKLKSRQGHPGQGHGGPMPGGPGPGQGGPGKGPKPGPKAE